MKTLLVITVSMLIVAALTGCQLIVSPDGTRTWSVDGTEVAKGIVVLATESK